jgi:nucleoid-associated protein YgaU
MRYYSKGEIQVKKRNLGIIVFAAILLSSCGLIEKFKSPESSSDSTTTAESNAPSDDLFNAAKQAEASNEMHADAPSNIETSTVENGKLSASQEELLALQNEFSNNGPNETSVKEAKPEPKPEPKIEPKVEPQMIAEAAIPKTEPKAEEKVVLAKSEPAFEPPTDEIKFFEKDEKPKVLQKKLAHAPKIKSAPLKIKEPIADVESELEVDAPKVSNKTTGEIGDYQIQKGDTLMQIAFKLYGDVSRWRELKKLNGNLKLAANEALQKNTSIKYKVPAEPFVWNPEGKPYIIKNGETLGTISNSVYKTPKKWKAIWNNNKPLIKNPNVIYTGFTIYYKETQMANYVQPKKIQPKVVKAKHVEEIKIEKALNDIERLSAGTSEDISDIRSSTVRTPAVYQEDPMPDTTSPPPAPAPEETAEDPE